MHRRIRGVLQGERHRHAAVVAELPQRRAQRGRKLRGHPQHLRRGHRQDHQVGRADLGIYGHPKIWRLHLERLRHSWDFQRLKRGMFNQEKLGILAPNMMFTELV